MVLTDILGIEDALGTMDFKVAGNEDGESYHHELHLDSFRMKLRQ